MTAQDLKNSILQQAVQGKLIPQNPDDETATELLKKISAERQKLIDEGKIKNSPPLPTISDDEKPFEIPKTWQWVRLGDLGNYRKGPFGSSLTKNIFVPKGTDTVKVYEQKNAIQKNAHIGNYYITKKYFDEKMSGFETLPGDIIVSCAGTIGESYVMPQKIEKGIINQALMRMRILKPMDINFFLVVFDFILKQNSQSSSKGSAIKNIPPFDIFKNFLVPLPPLEEQKRIVAKLEEILPLIERYGELEQRLTTLDKEFPDKLKKSLLQQAIQGKLTPHLSTDGNADDLLKKIQAEKSKLVAEGKIKKEKPLPPIYADEIPFEIPENWCWCRLGDIFNIRSSRRIHQSDWQSSGVPFLRGRELVQLSKFGTCAADIHISHSLYETLKIFGVPARGDILVSAVGTIGKAYVVKGSQEFYYKDAYVLCFENFGNLFPEFMKYALESPSLQKQIHADAMASTVKQLTIEKSKSIAFPLPPLAEQKRIVEQLEELLPLCEKLQF